MATPLEGLDEIRNSPCLLFAANISAACEQLCEGNNHSCFALSVKGREQFLYQNLAFLEVERESDL